MGGEDSAEVFVDNIFAVVRQGAAKHGIENKGGR